MIRLLRTFAVGRAVLPAGQGEIDRCDIVAKLCRLEQAWRIFHRKLAKRLLMYDPSSEIG